MANAIFRTNTIRVENAEQFVSKFWPSGGPVANDNHLYACVGQEDNPVGINPLTNAAYVAGGGIWPNDSIPPLPSDDSFQDLQVWSLCLGGIEVNPQNITTVAPAGATTPWTSGTIYASYSNNNPSLYNTNFFTFNTQNEVFMQVANPNGVASVTMPQWYTTYSNPATTANIKVDGATGYVYLNDGLQSIVITPEGIIWKYLYTMTSFELANILQQYWMPVNYGLNRWTPTTDPRYTQSQDSLGAFGLAPKILGAHYVMINAIIQSGTTTSGLIPSGLKYRQISLIENPLVNGSAVRATFTNAVQPNSLMTSGGTNQFQLNSGSVIYIENDSPIYTQSNQTQEIEVVIAF